MDYFSLLFFIGIPVLILAKRWARGADESWRKAGQLLGLRYSHGGLFSHRKLIGSIDGLRVSVETITKGKETLTLYRVRYPSLGLVDFKLKKEGILSGLTRLVGSQDIEVGDKDFDDAVVIKGKSPDRIADFLTPVRRVRIHRLLSSFPRCVIEESQIELKSSGTERKAEALISTVRRFCRLAQVLTEDAADQTGFAGAVEAKRAGQLDEALEHLADEATQEDVDSQVMRGEILLTAGQPAAAAEVLARAQVEVPDDAEVSALAEQALEAASATAPDMETDMGMESVTTTDGITDDEPSEVSAPIQPPQPVESPPIETIPLDEASVCGKLFAPDLMSSDVNRLFDATYSGRRVQWTGKLYRMDRYYSDLVFGSGPGTKAVFEIHDLDEDGYGGRMVRGVVQLPEGAANELQALSGQRFKLEGELVGCDAFMRNLFLAHGEVQRIVVQQDDPSQP